MSGNGCGGIYQKLCMIACWFSDAQAVPSKSSLLLKMITEAVALSFTLSQVSNLLSIGHGL